MYNIHMHTVQGAHSEEHSLFSLHLSCLPLVYAAGSSVPANTPPTGLVDGDAASAWRDPGRGLDQGAVAVRCVFLFALEG